MLAKKHISIIKYNGRFIALTALSLLIAFLCCSRGVYAQEIEQPVKFSISAVKSEKQVNQTASYFDLRMSPGEEHVLEVNIFNNADTPLNTLVLACTAGTNSGGVIDYDNTNVSDDSLMVSFADIATVENSNITVSANSVSRAKIKFTMPNEIHDGVILGSIVVKETDSEETENTNTTSIQNEYGYAIAVRITMNDVHVEPDFRLRYIEPKLSNYHTSIAVNLQNFKAAIAKGLKIDANIYFDGNDEPLFTESSSDFDVAPNSNFDYIVPSTGRLPSGNYRLHLIATLGEKIWEFDEQFIISADDVEDINKKAVNVPGINIYLIATIILSALLLILIAVLIIWFIVKKRKKSAKDNRDE